MQLVQPASPSFNCMRVYTGGNTTTIDHLLYTVTNQPSVGSIGHPAAAVTASVGPGLFPTTARLREALSDTCCMMVHTRRVPGRPGQNCATGGDAAQQRAINLTCASSLTQPPLLLAVLLLLLLPLLPAAPSPRAPTWGCTAPAGR
jgi:hypothetical protein